MRKIDKVPEKNKLQKLQTDPSQDENLIIKILIKENKSWGHFI